MTISPSINSWFSTTGHVNMAAFLLWGQQLETDVAASFTGDVFTSTISPSQLTASQDNYAPTGFATASTLRLSSDASRNITGLAGGVAGRVRILHNTGAQPIVLKDENASSTAANRFALNADVTLAADQSIMIQYDGTSARWRAIGGTGAGGGGATALSGLSDVTIGSLAANNMLRYSGSAWVNGVFADAAFPQTSTPTQITANQNDYTNANVVMRLSSDASRDITGLASGTGGMVRILHNVGSFNIVLKDESASSVAANRFALNGDMTIASDSSVILLYDSTSSRWRALGQPTAGGGSGDFSSNTATSVDGEIVLFSGTGGKTGKRATTTGLLKATSGVLAAAVSGTDYAPATSGSSVLKGNGSGGFSAASAVDLGITDAGSYFSTDNVEAALQYLGGIVAALDQAVVLKGTWDASAGTFPGAGVAQSGWSYIVSVAGTVNSVSFAVGDRIIAITDNASTSTYASNWFKADYTDAVSSVAGQTGAVTLAQADISGLTTGSTPLFAGINFGNADTTVDRASAGDIQVEGNRIFRVGGADVPLADGGTGASLTDPNADRIMFWDDSAGAVTWLEAGTGLLLSGTTLSVPGAAPSGGTTGQVLKKQSNSDYDYAWATDATSGGGGGGDVSGPVSVTNNTIVLWDGTTGDLIKEATTTGILKATSGVLSAAVSGTDYAPATSGSAILKGNGSGGFSSASAGTDYVGPTSGSAIQKANGSGGLTAATSGTDYAPATSGSSVLKANGSGGFSAATAADLGIADAGSYFSTDNVEAALQYLGGIVAALDQAVVLKGTWDASAGTFPGSGSAQSGWSYIVSVGGTVNSVEFTAGDRIIAITDNASATTYASNWFKSDYTDAVSSVAGRTGAVTLAQADISGLTTGSSPLFAGVSIGNADTPLARVSAGVISVAGVTVPTNSTSIAHIASQFLGGHATALAGVTGGGAVITPDLQMHGTGGGAAGMIGRWSNDAAGPRFVMAKSRGTSIGSYTVGANGDVAGEFVWAVADGTDLEPLASFRAEVDGTPGAGDMPGRFVWALTADGAEAVTDRMALNAAGLYVAGAFDLGNTSDTTLARVSAGVVSIEGETIHTNSTSRTLTAGTIELGHATANTLSASSGVLSIEGVALLKINGGQTLTGGFSQTAYSIGTVTSGTTTPNPSNGNYQYLTWNVTSSGTIAAPSSDCAIDILVTNNATGTLVAPTMSGFTAPTNGGGDTYAITNSNRYLLMIRRINGISTYAWKALQ